MSEIFKFIGWMVVGLVAGTMVTYFVAALTIPNSHSGMFDAMIMVILGALIGCIGLPTYMLYRRGRAYKRPF